MSLFIISIIIRNGHILAGIDFIFLKNVLKHSWKSFKTKFQPPSEKIDKTAAKGRKFYQFFCYLLALVLGYYCVKSLAVTKIVKEIKLEGVWRESEQKIVSRDNYPQNI